MYGFGAAGMIGGMRLGIADHLGWAVAVTVTADRHVADRRRIELIEPGMTPAPIHYESHRLDVAATAALVAKVHASVVRASSGALDDIASALSEPIVSISLRAWPMDFPDDIAVQRRAPNEARADAIMYRQVLSELAHARDWEVHLYDAKAVEGPEVPTRRRSSTIALAMRETELSRRSHPRACLLRKGGVRGHAIGSGAALGFVEKERCEGVLLLFGA
jgi:hypothetical protein